MPRLLIVESNPHEVSKALAARAGATFADVYAAALTTIDGTAKIEIISPYDGDDTPDLAGFDGVVFTGSSVEWNTDDRRAKPLASVMRAAFAAARPVIGSCNGMQLAASILGGSSAASPNGREDGMATGIELTEAGRAHPMMAGRHDGFAVPCTHRDEVVRLPEGAVRLAGNAHSRVQAFAIARDGIDFWGMQYHPEFTPSYVGRYLADVERVPPQVTADLMAAERDVDAAARLSTSPDEQGDAVRMLELRNWMARLRAGKACL